MTRSLLTPVLLAVLALGVAGCGGSDEGPDDVSADPSTSSATDEPGGSTSSAAPSEEPTSAAPSESAEPGDEGESGGRRDGGDEGVDRAAVTSSMQGSLDALVDRKTTPQQKADRVVDGADLAPLFQQFERSAGDSQLSFSVEQPVVDGRNATALVAAYDRGRPLVEPATTPFVLADGEWRLERATVCDFAQVVGLQCPPR